jgi:hypothetical protein
MRLRFLKVVAAAVLLIASSHLVQAAAPAFVKSSSLLPGTTSSNITPVNAGDSLLVEVFGSGAGTWGTTTSSVGSTVVQDVNTAHFAIYRVASCSNSSQDFTIGETGFGQIYSIVVEVSNLGSFDKATAEASGSSVSPLTNSLTPSNNDSYLVAQILTSAGLVSFSSWTNSFTQNQTYTGGPSMADAHLVQTSGPASVNAGATLSGSEPWMAELAAYAPAAVVGQAEASATTGQTSLATSTSLNAQAGDDFFITVASGSPTTPVLENPAGGSTIFDGAVSPQTGLYEYGFEVLGAGANSATVFTAQGTSIYGIAALQVRGLVTDKPIFAFATPPSRLAWGGTYVPRAAFSENAQAAPGAGTDAVTSTTTAPAFQPALVIGFSAIPGEHGAAVNAAPNGGTGFSAQTGVWSTWGGGAGDYLGVFETEQVASTSAVAATFTAPTYGSGNYGTFVWIVPELP